MKKRTYMLAIFALLVMLVIAACSNGDNSQTALNEQTGQEQENEAQTTRQGKDETIVLAAPRDLAPGKEDPYYTSSILYVWEPLITTDEAGEVKPSLATSWKMSEDATLWTFYLRNDVVFHDGEPFNAEAVVANFERYRLISPKGSPFYAFNIDAIYPGLLEVEAVDEYTVQLHFSRPQPSLPYYMVNFSSAMFSPNNFDEQGNFNGIPQGTGPFILVNHEMEQYARLERNENYYGEKARAKSIEIRVIPDVDTRYAALRTEEIMGVMDLGGMTPTLAQQLIVDDRFEQSVAKSTITHYLTPNGNKPPFDQLEMRQAVSYLIDREVIVNELFAGYGQPTTNILNYVSPYAMNIEPTHDVERAIQLAEQVLQGETMEIELIVPTWGLDRYPYKEKAEYIQAVLKQIGLEANITILDGAAFREHLAQGDFHLALNIQGLPNGEPYTIFERFMHSAGSTNEAYNLGFHHSEVDELLAQVASSLDENERVEIYNTLQRISAELLPTIPLFYDQNVIVYNNAIKGYESYPYGTSLPQVEWR